MDGGYPNRRTLMAPWLILTKPWKRTLKETLFELRPLIAAKVNPFLEIGGSVFEAHFSSAHDPVGSGG